MDIYILVRYDGIVQCNVGVSMSERFLEELEDKLIFEQEPEDCSIYNIEHWEC